ncbi:MAG: hypothetical protein AAGJ67_13395 [Pseudomonadota bacterium]
MIITFGIRTCGGCISFKSADFIQSQRYVQRLAANPAKIGGREQINQA